MAESFKRFKQKFERTAVPTDQQQELMEGLPYSGESCMEELPYQGLQRQATGGAGSSQQAEGRSSKLLSESLPGKGFQRFRNVKGAWRVYYKDVFHTLLNMPGHRFLLVFFGIYLSLFFFFGLLYLSVPDDCLVGVIGFYEAMWFSVRTASTLGFGSGPHPDADCVSINVLMMFNIIVAALVDYLLMGLVFARFASPMPYASTIRFSAHAVLHLRSLNDGCVFGGEADSSRALTTYQSGEVWTISFRMANIRKHSLLKPQLTVMLAVPVPDEVTEFRFYPLTVDDLTTQKINMKLGLVATIRHHIDAGSPLYGLSLDAMEKRGIEILCFVDGIDPMTSHAISAHASYDASKIRMNEHFEAINLQTNSKGTLGLDFEDFDASVVATSIESTRIAHDDSSHLVPNTQPASSLSPQLSSNEMASHMAELRRHTIKELSDLAAPSGSARACVDLMAGSSIGSAECPSDVFVQQQQQMRELVEAVLVDPETETRLKELARCVHVEIRKGAGSSPL